MSSVSGFVPHNVGGIRSASQEMGWVRARNVRESDEEYREFKRNEFKPKEGKVRCEKEGGEYGNRVPLPGTAASGAPGVLGAQAAADSFTDNTDTNTVSSSRRPYLPDTTATMTAVTVTRQPVSHNKDVMISSSAPPEDERHRSFSKSPQNDVDPIQFAWPNVFNGRDRKAGTLINEISLGSMWTSYLQQDDDNDGVDNTTVSGEEGVGVTIPNDGMVGRDAVLHDKKHDENSSNSIVDFNGETQRGKPSAPAAATATQTCASGCGSTEVDDATQQLMIDTANLIYKNDRALGKAAFENILQQRECFNVELQWLQPGKALSHQMIVQSSTISSYCDI